MNKEQIKPVIRLLKSKCISTRPTLQQIFEHDNHLWASDGYIVFDICEIQPELKGKCAKLNKLIAWNALHTKKSDILDYDIFEINEYLPPNINSLIKGEFLSTSNFKFNIKYLDLCCEFLGCQSITLKVNENNKELYQVIPLNTSEQSIIIRALESKAYLMGIH